MITEKRRLVYIDFLTILSSFAVVMLHANGIFWSHPTGRLWITANCIECIFYFAVPVFFMITGTTLMDYKERYSTKDFLIRRFLHVGIPFIIWSSISVLVYGNLSFQNFLAKETLRKFIDGIWNENYMNIYWFFLPLFSIYLSIPLLSSVQNKQKNFFFIIVLVLSIIAGNFLMLLLQKRYGCFIDLKKIYPPVAAYPLIYPLLGYYLANCRISKRDRIIIYVLGLLGTSVHIAGTILLSPQGTQICRIFKGYHNLPAVLQAIAVFVFVKNINFDRIPEYFMKIIAFVKPYTFFVYLVHMYFINYVSKNHPAIYPSILFRTLGTFCIFIICILLGWLLSKFKWGKILIGFPLKIKSLR